jgi:long-chain acyl-CoA synthetase
VRPRSRAGAVAIVNLASIIERHAADTVALRHEGRNCTYGELRARCASARIELTRHEVRPSDRVALVLPTTPEFVVAYFAVLGAGAVAVPLNPESPIAELAKELGTIRAKAVLLGGPRAERLRGPISELGYVVIELAVSAVPTEPAVPAEPAEPAEPAVPGAADDAPAGEAPALVDRRPDDTAVLLFTSGTAGSPKAAMLTHGNLRANVDQMELAVGLSVTADDVGLLVVPTFHIYGLNAVLGVHLFAGGRLVMMERFDPAALLEMVPREGVTVLPGVPQLFAALADHPGAKGDELSSIRLACSGAAPLPLDVAERFEARFGVPIWQAYGLTEASPTVTFPDLHGARRPLAVGVPLPGIEVQIVDSDGQAVEHGDPGEILVRGPNVFVGYFEDTAATKSALDRAGWLHTGDVGVMDDEGSLTIVDRDKDLVIVSGFNVFPAEVERVLEEHPAVVRAVVVGVPDPVLGESVRAIVVPTTAAWAEAASAPEGVTAAELIDWCAQHLARYKCPGSVTFVRELPLGIQGKVLRRALA